MPLSITIKCANCETTKTFANVKPRDAAKKYCGRSCYYEGMRRRGRPEIMKQVAATCAGCGQSFTDRRSKISRRKFCSLACRGKWQAALPYDDWRGKLSSSRANRRYGPDNHKFGKEPSHPGNAVPYQMLDGRVIKLRSSWEVHVATYLDQKKIRWEYEPKRFDLGSMTYRPDFFLVEDGVYWEVKGWFHEKAQAKIERFRDMYPDETLVMITKPAYQMLKLENHHA